MPYTNEYTDKNRTDPSVFNEPILPFIFIYLFLTNIGYLLLLLRSSYV